MDTYNVSRPKRHIFVNGQRPRDKKHQAHRLEPRTPCRRGWNPVFVGEGRTMFLQTFCRRANDRTVIAVTTASVPCRQSDCLRAVNTCPCTCKVKVVATSDIGIVSNSLGTGLNDWEQASLFKLPSSVKKS